MRVNAHSPTRVNHRATPNVQTATHGTTAATHSDEPPTTRTVSSFNDCFPVPATDGNPIRWALSAHVRDRHLCRGGVRIRRNFDEVVGGSHRLITTRACTQLCVRQKEHIGLHLCLGLYIVRDAHRAWARCAAVYINTMSSTGTCDVSQPWQRRSLARCCCGCDRRGFQGLVCVNADWNCTHSPLRTTGHHATINRGGGHHDCSRSPCPLPPCVFPAPCAKPLIRVCTSSPYPRTKAAGCTCAKWRVDPLSTRSKCANAPQGIPVVSEHLCAPIPHVPPK